MIQTPVRNERATRTPVDEPGTRARRHFDDPIRSAVAALAGLAWIVFLPISLAAQPPAEPAASPSALADTISLVFTALMFGAIVGLTMRRRWGVLATIGGGVTMMTAASLCYLTGHTGAWIAIQLVAGAGLAASARFLDRAI